MKLSELKEKVIAIRGKEKWEEIENSKIFKIYMAPEEEQLKIVQRDGCCIKFIKNPSEKVQLEAIRENVDAIKYITNPSEKIQLEAVRQTGYDIRYIKEPSEELQLEAIRENADAIQYIKNPIEKVQLEAVKKYGYVIGYIDNPSEELIDYIIHNKNLEIIKYTLRHIENDLFEKTFKLSELRNKTLEEIKDLLNKYLLNK